MNFFLTVTNFDKQGKTQLLAKFKKILFMGLRATLHFRKCSRKLPQIESSACIHNNARHHIELFQKSNKKKEGNVQFIPVRVLENLCN